MVVFNIHQHLEYMLIQLQQNFPNIEQIQLKSYQFGLSDYGVMYSDFLDEIIQYSYHLKMIFYTFDILSQKYQIVKIFDLTHQTHIQHIKNFYFEENLQSQNFCYFYILYDIYHHLIIVSDDSSDLSLLLYQPNQVSKNFKQTIPDYFIMLNTPPIYPHSM